MPRIFFSKQSRDIYFHSLKTLSKLSWEQLAKELGMSNRHLRDIRNGVYSLSILKANAIKKHYDLLLPKDIFVKNDRWHMSNAAKLGGKRRLALYGPPGTPEGRKKGGINSIKTHKRLQSGFILSNTIKHPPNNTKLAELVGALLGNGGISPRQVKISLNLYNDNEYAMYLTNLIQELFHVKTSIYIRENYSVINLVVSSTKLVSFLNKKGLPIGSKIKHELDIPFWIHRHRQWQKACLRGLFDTDGCTYIDYHNYKNKRYGHIALNFKSYSEPLLESIQKTLIELNYSPTTSTKHGILLRREREVIKFFNEIKPRNKRHWEHLKKFLEEYRSGRNGAVSKTAVV